MENSSLDRMEENQMDSMEATFKQSFPPKTGLHFYLYCCWNGDTNPIAVMIPPGYGFDQPLIEPDNSNQIRRIHITNVISLFVYDCWPSFS